MDIQIDEIKVGKRFRKDIGSLKKLKESIEDIGLLQPIVVDKDNNLIAGLRRLKGFEELGKKKIPVNKVDLQNSIKGEFDENIIRKDFTPSEAVAIWEAMEKKSGGAGGSSKLSESDSLRRERASKLLGVSTDTLSKAKQVVESNDDDLIKEMDKSGNVNKAYRDLKKKEKKKQETPPLPKGKYDVIYADPPWQYDNTGITGAAEKHYNTMSVEEICSLEIPSAKNSVLFLWATNPMIEEGLKVMKKWGFEYKTNMAWIKNKAGQGFYVKGQHELLLLGVKGKKRPDEHLYIRSVVEAPREEHSKKPDIFYEIIEKMYPNGKYLELFARQTKENWEAWGNEIS